MIIKKLVLHNFGVYASTNVFTFSGKKPVVLIGGLNGRGKTTFLEAVLIALYGSNSFAYTESAYNTYGKYLRAHVNTLDGSYETFIELEFSMGDENADVYCIHREWSAQAKRIKEDIAVKKNGKPDEFLTENWSMFIESLLPSGLSSFFFFDGEKIAELAAEETNAQVKNSIKALLGITVLDQLESDLGRMIARVNKETATRSEEDELDALRAAKEKADNDYQAALDEIADLKKQCETIDKQLESTHHEYSAKGGDLVYKRQDLFHKRSQLEAKAKNIQDQLTDTASSCLPLSLVPDLLEVIEQQSVLEHNSQVAVAAAERLENLYAQFAASSSVKSSGAQKFLRFVREETEKDYVPPVYGLSDSCLYQLKELRSRQLKQQRRDAFAQMEEREELKKQINQIDQYLSVDIDEAALARIYKKIKTLEQEQLDLEVRLAALTKKAAGLHGESSRATAAFNDYVEKMLLKLELKDDSERILKYSHQAIHLVQEYRIRLQEKKIQQLADTMTACYKRLANKKNLIECIKMDPVSLDFEYLTASGIPVPKASLSAGEKQLMVISILWALAICSKKKLPVIIDTPLSRLDSAHRISLIQSYFPEASDQTIILSTDSEIDQRYYDLMKDNIGDEFTLYYDDEKKCSIIKQGYFTGGAL